MNEYQCEASHKENAQYQRLDFLVPFVDAAARDDGKVARQERQRAGREEGDQATCKRANQTDRRERFQGLSLPEVVRAMSRPAESSP